MDVDMNTLVSQEMMVNKAQVGADILQKTLEKTEQARQSNQSVERPDISRVSSTQGRLVDIYT